MSDLIADYNFASRLSDYYRQGTLAAVVLIDLLTERGFYGISVEDGTVTAWMNNIRLDLGKPNALCG